MKKFDFKRRLGSGYFGEVWYVKDTNLNSHFALKCIPPSKLLNQKNFFTEAQNLKAAEHPNIVKVTEAGTLDDGRIYVKMEYLKNGSLEDEASGQYVPLSRSKKLMIDTLRGLEYAHQQGIIHRDIKPANILVSNAKDGKLSDFGLAIQDIENIDSSYFKKYQYMMHKAPEVNSIKDYNELSDIYACGVTLYRLINGDSYLPQVFTIAELKDLVKTGKFPNRHSYREFIPRQLRVIVNKAMNVDPSKRFQIAAEMRHALEQINCILNWTQNNFRNSVRFKTSHNRVIYEVTRTQKSGIYEVATRKGPSKTKMRRVTKHSQNFTDEKKAISFTKKVLQYYVNGGK